MDIKTLIQEIKKFIEENKKVIFFSTCIVVVVAIILQFIGDSFGSDVEKTTDDSLQQINSFEVYIEQDNLGAFTNSYLLESFLKREDVVKQVEQETNISITPVLKNYKENNDIITTTDEDPINVKRDTSTNIMTISVGIGTEQENLEIAQAYFDWFTTSDHALFNDKVVFAISEPNSIEIEANNQTQSTSLTSIAIRLVLALFGGLVLGIAISLVKVFFNKKIMYGFAYSWGEEDVYLNYSNDLQYKDIAHSIIQPNIGNKVVLSEKSLNSVLLDNLNNLSKNQSNLIISSNVSDIDSKITIDEFVIVVIRKETSKLWYQSQRNQLKSYRSSLIKVVQI